MELLNGRSWNALSFYAGYDVLNTDIAVFQTEEARDIWLKNESIIHRVAFSKDEAMQIAEDTLTLHKDEYDDEIMWIYNRINI